MSQVVYNRFKHRSATGLTVVGTSDFRALLLETTAAGAFDPDLDTVADLLAVGSVAELVAANYARKTLTGETGTQDDTNDRENVDMTIPVWSALGAASGDSVAALVIFDEGAGADASRFLVGYYDTGFPVALNGGDFEATTPNDVLRLT